MSFNLKDAEEKQSGTTYQKVGIYDNVKITNVLLDKSTVKQSPYIKLVTQGPNGEIGSSSAMYISNTKSEGKKTTAWAITAANLVNLITATQNCSDEEAKTMINVDTPEQLVNKVSALLVGKPFRAKFKGEEAKNGSGTVYATLGQVESMKIPKEGSSLRFNPEKDIKKYEGPVVDGNTTTPAETSDLPF